MGLGAMISGVLDVESSNMSAPLLAQSFGTLMFAIISAIAFANVLGTGIISIPLSFTVLIIVSLMTQEKGQLQGVK